MLQQHKNFKNRLHPVIYGILFAFMIYVIIDATEYYDQPETKAVIIEFQINGAIASMEDQLLRFTLSE